MCKNQRVVFSKTEREWIIIKKRVKELGFSSVSRYINSRLISLKKDYEMQPVHVSQKAIVETRKIQHVVPKSIPIDFIEEISEATNIPTSTIIDRIIISPLLTER